MAKMVFDEEGLLEEPCLSCDKAYTENIWYEWCCDEKECPYILPAPCANLKNEMAKECSNKEEKE